MMQSQEGFCFKKRRRKQCAPICSPDSAEAVKEVRTNGAGMLESLPHPPEQALNPERWQQVEKIFNEALEQNPNDRAVFLDNACGEDAWLRQKVETLIRSDEA